MWEYGRVGAVRRRWRGGRGLFRKLKQFSGCLGVGLGFGVWRLDEREGGRPGDGMGDGMGWEANVWDYIGHRLLRRRGARLGG